MLFVNAMFAVANSGARAIEQVRRLYICRLEKDAIFDTNRER